MGVTKIGKILRDKRIERDEYLKDMADYLEISSSEMSRLERGLDYYTKDIIYKLKDKYNLSNENIFEMTKQFSGSMSEIVNILAEIRHDGGVLDMSERDRIYFEQLKQMGVITASVKCYGCKHNGDNGICKYCKERYKDLYEKE